MRRQTLSQVLRGTLAHVGPGVLDVRQLDALTLLVAIADAMTANTSSPGRAAPDSDNGGRAVASDRPQTSLTETLRSAAAYDQLIFLCSLQEEESVILDELLDVHTLAPDDSATTLGLNDIGRVRLRTSTPLAFDPYAGNRATGSFIPIDETTHDTVGAAMIPDAPTLGA